MLFVSWAFSDINPTQSCHFNTILFAKTFFYLNAAIERVESLNRDGWEKTPLGGVFCYADVCMDSVIYYSKIFLLHAVIYDPVGAAWSHTGGAHGHCYIFEQNPDSSLLGQVTGLLFPPYAKLFLPSIFKSVNFEALYLVLSWYVKTLTVFQEVKFFSNVIVRGCSLHPPKVTDPENTHFGAHWFCTELFITMEVWFTRSSETLFLKK